MFINIVLVLIFSRFRIVCQQTGASVTLPVTCILQVVERLVGQGADVTMTNREGQTAVELASTAIVRQLLLAAVDKGGPHHNLCQAAWQGNTAVLHNVLVCVAIIVIRNILQIIQKMKD